MKKVNKTKYKEIKTSKRKAKIKVAYKSNGFCFKNYTLLFLGRYFNFILSNI